MPPDTRTRPRSHRLLALLALTALAAATAALVAACGGGSADPAQDGQQVVSTGEVTVSAAASVGGAMGQIAEDFAEENPGVEVRINTGSSTQLARQVLDGAPADVVAFADSLPMDEVAAAGLVDGSARPFATNSLAIVTEPGNPSDVTALPGLARLQVVALCAATAPCGRFADLALSRAGIALDPTRTTRAPDARATLGAVAEGDADAAVVYLTDARSAGDAVTTVEIAPEQNLVATYPIAVLADASDPDAARAFVEWVLGDSGRAVLVEHGFGMP